MYTFRLFSRIEPNMSTVTLIALYIAHLFALCSAVFAYSSVILFTSFILIIPVALLFQLLRECKPIYGPTSWNKFKTKNYLRHLDTMIKVYNTMTLLVSWANECFSWYLLIIQNLVSYVIVACNVAFLYLRRSLSWKLNAVLIAFASATLLIWITALYAAGHLFKTTKRWIGVWKRSPWLIRNRNSKYYRRVIKSFRPASITCSKCFVVTLVRVLRFLNFITWGTMKGLLYMNNHK